MDTTGKTLEKHYKKIIIPDGSIKPNETVIIELPSGFQSNRTFLTTRGNLNSPYSTVQPVSKEANACNQTKTKNAASVNISKPLDVSSGANESIFGNLYGSLNSSYGSKNSSGKFFAPQYTSTPKKPHPYTSKEPTLYHSLNPTLQHSYKIGDYNTIDPSSSYLNTQYDSSSGNIDDSLMGKILRGEVGRVLVWPTPPSQRVNATYDFRRGGNSLSVSSDQQSNLDVLEQKSEEYTNQVNLSNSSINLTSSNSKPQKRSNSKNLNYSKFAPPFSSTVTNTKYGGFNYTGHLPPQCFQRTDTNVVTPSTTSVGTYAYYSSDGSHNATTDSGNVTGNLNTDVSNALNLTCSSYDNLPRDKKVSFEKSTTTVQTYQEEGENKLPKIIQKTTNSETKTTEVNPNISVLRNNVPSFSSNLCQTVNLNNLSLIEERERNQLENDLRRMQEARRLLAMHAAKIDSTNLR